MINILLFIFNHSTKFENLNFLETDTILLTNMIFRVENMLVFESKIGEGCRVLLSRRDLLTLHD